MIIEYLNFDWEYVEVRLYPIAKSWVGYQSRGIFLGGDEQPILSFQFAEMALYICQIFVAEVVMVRIGQMNDLAAMTLYLMKQCIRVSYTANQKNGCGGIHDRMGGGYLGEERVERTIMETGEIDGLIGVNLESLSYDIVVDGF